MSKHPIQPLVVDEHGTTRFKENKIVRYLLDNGGIDMNTIVAQGFDPEEHRQFAQLIGYSLSGFGSLSYCDNATYATAHDMHEQGMTEAQARLKFYEELVAKLKDALREPIAELFEMHPSDLS